MIWFRIKNLENRIINNQLSDRACLNYLLVLSAILIVYFTVQRQNNSYNSSMIVFIKTASSIVITIWGLLLTYKTNELGDNIDYFKRFIAIQVVCLVRLTVFLWTILFFIIFITNLIFGVEFLKAFQNTETFHWIFIFFGIVVKFYFFLMMNNSFKRLIINK